MGVVLGPKNQLYVEYKLILEHKPIFILGQRCIGLIRIQNIICGSSLPPRDDSWNTKTDSSKLMTILGYFSSNPMFLLFLQYPEKKS